MQKLSYRETAVALGLIAAASIASYRLWFVPALAQIERDRHTLEALVATLAKPVREAAPALIVSQDVGQSAPVTTPALAPRPVPGRKLAAPEKPTPKRDLTTNPRCAARDPLCGDLEL